MEMKKPVHPSSNVEAIGHDGNDMRVQFKDKDGKPGVTHQYTGVPVEMFHGMLIAESPGRYFHKNIKSLYPSERMDAS